MHLVAVAQGVGKPLQDDQRAALSADEAVRPGVEDVTPPVRGVPAEALDAQGALRCEVEVHPARQCERRIATAQVLTGQVDRHQGRGLAGVHRQARPAQPQGVREAVRDHAAPGAGEGVPGDGRRARPADECRVVVPHRADVDAGRRPRHPGRDDARLFQGLPAEFQHQPLLRVHRIGLARGDPEEGRVEPVDVRQVPARAPRSVPACAGAADRGWLRCHCVRAVAQQPPEGVGGRRSRKAARQPDHRDRAGIVAVSRPVAGRDGHTKAPNSSIARVSKKTVRSLL